MLLKKDPTRPLVARMGKAKTSRRSSRLRPTASYATVHTRHKTTPKRKTLNAMIEEKEKEGDAHVGLMQLLKALKTKSVPKTPQTKGLMYVEAHVNDKPTKAMMDTDAAHNFVFVEEAKRPKLHAFKKGG